MCGFFIALFYDKNFVLKMTDKKKRNDWGIHCVEKGNLLTASVEILMLFPEYVAIIIFATANNISLHVNRC